MSRWLQVIKCTALVRGVGQWSARVLSTAAEPLTDDKGGTEKVNQVPEGAHVYSITGPFKKGNNWNDRAELSALAIRLGYEAETLPSLVTALQQEGQFKPASRTNEVVIKHNRLSVLGRTTMMHYVNEYIYFTYPEMDGSMLIDIATAITNQDALVKLANHIGISDLIRTKVDLSPGSSTYIISQSFYAVVGAVYRDQGPKAAKKLVHDFVIPQLSALDLQEVVKLEHPRFMLNAILSKHGSPKPVSRLISESGRATHFPSFVVGVFSGDKCLGEGTGTSLRRAEQEAMRTALRIHFQKELSSCPLPSDHEDFVMESALKERVVCDGANPTQEQAL